MYLKGEKMASQLCSNPAAGLVLPVEVRIRQFVRGTEGEVKDKETAWFRIQRNREEFPVFTGCPSSEVKFRSFDWIWYRNRKWQVRINHNGEWVLTLPGEEIMKNITWGDLLTRLQELSAKELEDTATVQLGGDEFMGLTEFCRSEPGNAADGILDHGHLFLVPMFGRKED